KDCSPTCDTQPPTICPTSAGSIFARSTAARCTTPSRSAGCNPESPPLRRPMGLRTADRMTTSCMGAPLRGRFGALVTHRAASGVKPREPVTESAERRQHLLREHPGRLARVTAEDLDHEERAAEPAMALDALDPLLGRSPDAVLLEAAARHVAAVDAPSLAERVARTGLVGGDHHQALLGDLD